MSRRLFACLGRHLAQHHRRRQFRRHGHNSERSGHPFTGSHNLIGDSETAGDLHDGEDGNIVGVNGVGVRDINTILNTTLADNGGPTMTHSLVGGSLAINNGDNDQALAADGTTALQFDQRGEAFTRFLAGTTDIGAFEGTVTTTIISDGSGLDIGIVDGPGTQHSMIREIVIKLDGPIDELGDGDTFRRKNDNIAIGDRLLILERLEGGSRFNVFVGYEIEEGDARLVLTFSADGFSSLEDGNYVLHFEEGFTGVDNIKFHRLFGDADGDHDVDRVDKAAFDAASGTAPGDSAYRDYDDSNRRGIAATDRSGYLDFGSTHIRYSHSFFQQSPRIMSKWTGFDLPFDVCLQLDSSGRSRHHAGSLLLLWTLLRTITWLG